MVLSIHYQDIATGAVLDVFLRNKKQKKKPRTNY